LSSSDLHVVTGAFGFSGSYIAARLLDRGHAVRTLTNSPADVHALWGKIDVRPLRFEDPGALADSLCGARVLYNTYWVRFNHKRFTMARAVENSLALFAAAGQAGVERIVHTSVANPSEQSPFEYFRGKARVERGLRESGVSYAILRPAVLFGPQDILINNIAWAIRRFPVFGVFGDGQYRLQPIFVEDFAELAVTQGAAREDRIIDAVGPETFTYIDLVRTLGSIIGRRPRIVSVPPRLGHAITRAAGLFTGDVILTWEEIGALMADLLCTGSPPVGSTKLTDWARDHADTLGGHYASELARRQPEGSITCGT